MLGRRLISAAIIISVVIFLIWCDYQLGLPSRLGRPGIVLAVLAIVVAGMAAGELAELLQTGEVKLSFPVAILTTVLMVATDAVRFLWVDYPANCPVGTLGWGVIGLGVAVGLVFLWELRNYGMEPAGNSLERSCRYLFVLVYLQVLFAFLFGHRLLALDSVDANLYGLFLFGAFDYHGQDVGCDGLFCRQIIGADENCTCP